MSSREDDDRDDVQYPNVVRAVAETPWAMLPARFAVVREIIAARARGERLTEDEIQARIGAGPSGRRPAAQGTIAILPIYGVIVPRATLFTKMSGGTALTDFQDSFNGALNDPAIDGILLDIDSPGGSTDLVPETASMIRAARGRKPIVAIANTMAASAAYWLAAQADELAVTPSGEVGSIGVFAAHEDISAQLEQDGVKVTMIRAGKYKADTNPFEPLTEEAQQAIQERVDEFYGMFVRDVAKGRNVSVDTVRSGFGEGRIVTAKNALAGGMVDSVATFEETVSQLIRTSIARKDSQALAAVEPPGRVPDPLNDQAASSGLSFADEQGGALTRMASFVARAQSLTDLRRGQGRDLSAASRELIESFDASLTEAHDALQAVLAAPVDHVAVLNEVVRYEALRATHT